MAYILSLFVTLLRLPSLSFFLLFRRLWLILLFVFQIKSNYNIGASVHMLWLPLLLICWQVVHAIYVVQKYQDWYRGLYLEKVKKITKMSLFILLVGGLFFAFSFGGFRVQVVEIMGYIGMSFAAIVGAMCVQYFGRSLINLYHFYTKPKSFWDL